MYQDITLKNGIRLLHRQTSDAVAHCGLIINTGSREESEKENGMAHFIEHMVFKGTNKRKAFHILSRMENVGGELNAYTTKEETCVYCSFLPEYYERSIELIQDLVFNSVFPAKEMEKEKDVVMDEINSYRDTPSEEIYDEYENQIYDGHSIGRNILGTRKTVKKFNKKMIDDFILNNYHSDQMIISSVGNISFEKLQKIILKYYGELPANLRTESRSVFQDYKPQSVVLKRKNYLSHACIGNLAYPRKDERRLAMVLLNNILGGPGMNSRLNLSIREKYGFAYNIESQYYPYSDTGVFCIYLGTDAGYMDKATDLVNKELALLRDKKMGTLQLKRAKQQIIGQLAISLESNLSRMLSAGKSVLHLGKVDPVANIISRIEKISSEDLIEVANDIFNPSELSSLIYKSKP
jgi:predicted Zn-dependent peptidase